MCFGRSKKWKGTIQQLQQEMSIISRVIIHPKYRGIGLGEKLVKETLPQAGTPNVEAVAVMAKYNPFFERAGMQKIAQSKPTQATTQALTNLNQLGFDTELLSNITYNEKQINQTGKEKIRKLLETLSLQDASKRKRLACLQSVYPKHEEFQTKINNMETADLAKVLKRLCFGAQTKIYLFWANANQVN